MNKKLAITALVVTVLASAVIIAVVLNPAQPPVNQGSQGTGATPPAPVGQTPSTQQPGEYRDYQDGNIQTTPGTKILFFYAPWCPQCRALEKSIKEGTIPSDTTIFKVDYDSNQALRQKYGVTIQTSLVKVDDNGNLIAKYVAYEHPTLQALIDNLL